MEEISGTGFWAAETAHIHHVFCEPLAQWISEYLKDYKEYPIYDFGCGLGNYLAALNHNGFKNLTGYEGDPAHRQVYHKIIKQDLTKPFTVEKPGICIFLEVAEHIPAEFEKAALDNVTNACSGKLITSWAIRGQAGFGHVNCLDNHEAIEKFTSRGFKYLEEDSKAARSIDLESAPWFKNTILIFEKESTNE